MTARRFARRAAKTPTAWVLTEDDGYSQEPFGQTTGDGTITTILVAGQAAGAGNPLDINRCTVLRVKGQIWLADTQPPPDYNVPEFNSMHLGVKVVNIAANQIQEQSPSLAWDGDASWMWLDQYLVAPCASSVPAPSVGSAKAVILGYNLVKIDLDIKVKRKLLPDQALCLFTSCTGSTDRTVNVWCKLRTLISRTA